MCVCVGGGGGGGVCGVFLCVFFKERKKNSILCKLSHKLEQVVSTFLIERKIAYLGHWHHHRY